MAKNVSSVNDVRRATPRDIFFKARSLQIDHKCAINNNKKTQSTQM